MHSTFILIIEVCISVICTIIETEPILCTHYYTTEHGRVTRVPSSIFVLQVYAIPVIEYFIQHFNAFTLYIFMFAKVKLLIQSCSKFSWLLKTSQ